MCKNVKHTTALLVILACCLSISGSLWAETLVKTLPNGIPVNAEYLPANPQKPAMLVLHGFLQNFEFLATRNIINGLAEMDYTVLAPNLSLGVPNRKQSKQCQAAHSTTLQDDLTEIDFWVKWLQQQGYTSIILVGHSWGSQHSLAYKLQYPGSPVSAIIAISLVRTNQPVSVHATQIRQAHTRLQENNNALSAYKLSFCNDFTSTPKTYLSYAEWSDDHIIKSLSQLQKQQVPVYLIIGGADKRTDQAWLDQLKPRVTEVTVIDGANHFFSQLHEFDLNDQLERILKTHAQ